MTDRLRVLVRPGIQKLRTRVDKEIVNDITFIDESGANRIHQLRRFMTGLFRHERFETSMRIAVETQGYAERLIQEALKYGPTHKPTMELFDFWMNEKDLVHKVFKVFVPRYSKFEPPYTKIHAIPSPMGVNDPPHGSLVGAMLEMKGHPYPAAEPKPIENRNSLANILIAEAKKQHHLKNQKLSEELAQLPKKTYAPEPLFPHEFVKKLWKPRVHY